VAGVRAFAAGIRGEAEEARKHEGEFEAIAGGDPTFAWVRHFLRLMIAFARGDHEKAQAAAGDALRLADSPDARLDVHGLILQWAADAREWHYFDEFGEEGLARARSSGSRYYAAMHCLPLGIHRLAHGRLEEAEALLGEAQTLFRTLDCRWDLGRTLRELALLRRAQGRLGEAGPLLQEARECFEALRALPDLERTRALMETV